MAGATGPVTAWPAAQESGHPDSVFRLCDLQFLASLSEPMSSLWKVGV